MELVAFLGGVEAIEMGTGKAGKGYIVFGLGL